MFTKNLKLAICVLIFVMTTSVFAVNPTLKKAIEGSSLNAKTKTYALTKLAPLSTNKVFVAEVKKQNAKKMTLAQIKKIDEEWQNAEEELAIMTTVTTNACAKEVIKALKGLPAVVEAFVMDNQGAVVGENALTSDYWQGDEAKWKNSFNGGKGGIDAGKVKFDKSANTELQQISIPVFDESGKVIGAITFGVAVSKI